MFSPTVDTLNDEISKVDAQLENELQKIHKLNNVNLIGKHPIIFTYKKT